MEVKRCDGLKLVNEHGDLYYFSTFLLFRLSSLSWRNFKKYIEEKKWYGLKRAQSPLLDDANYNPESDDFECFESISFKNCVTFSQIIY